MKIEEAKIRFEEIETYTHGFYDDVLIKKRDVKVLLDQLDQPKPVVPKFVGEWIEEAKAGGYSLYTAFDLVDGDNRSFDWLFDDHESNQDTFARAWLDGYEVEKEKLYTVEIPNPNGCNLYLIKLDKEVAITSDFIADAFPEKLQLTEQEIRKDYDWAFRWAKEVTND